MKSFMTFLIALTFLIRCQTKTSSTKSSEEGIETEVVHEKKDYSGVIDTTAYRDLIQGAWAKNENSNTAFKIKGDSLFYFEDPKPVYYDVTRDSFRVFIGDKKYSSKVIKLSIDSFERIEYGEVIKLYKRHE